MSASDQSPLQPVPANKRLAVFLDGTWNTVNDNTNVWRLRALCASTERRRGRPARLLRSRRRHAYWARKFAADGGGSA